MYLTDPSEANPYAQSAADRASASSTAGSGQGKFDPFGKDGLTFGDLLDVINPLQHIPIISTIYRRLTGDELGMAPRLMGGALFGGFVGFIAALANTVVEQATGKDIGDQVASLVLGDPGSATTAVAAATPGETQIEGLPWLETATHGTPLLVGPPHALTARPPLMTMAALTTAPIRIPAAPIERAAAPSAAIGETPIEGLPWLETAAHATPLLVGPPHALTARPPVMTMAALTTTPIRIPAAPIESAAAPSAAIGESIADPFVATRLAGQATPLSRARAQPAPPIGATANAGGWFSDVMLTALDRYQATGKLAEPSEKRRVDLTH